MFRHCLALVLPVTLAATQSPLFQRADVRVTPVQDQGPWAGAPAADFDLDGDVDIVVVGDFGLTFQPAALQFLRNDGRGVFSPPPWPMPTVLGSVSDVAVGDFDGNGWPDIYVARSGDINSLFQAEDTLMLNQGGGVFSARPATATHTMGRREIRAFDADGDGDVDLLHGDNGMLDLWMNNGTGLLTPISGRFPAGASASSALLAEDLDGDGDVDVLASSGGNVALYSNNGQGVFAVNGGFTFGSTAGETFCAGALDVDGDGDLDLVVLGRDASRWSLLLANGAGGYLEAPQGVPAVPGFLPSELAVADVNRDGRQDLILQGGQAPVVWQNTGSGGFVDVSDGIEGLTWAAPRRYSVVVEELDGQPGADLFLPSDERFARHMLWRNDGTGNFEWMRRIATPVGEAPEVADLDGDGIDDLVRGGGEGSLAADLEYWRGRGDGTFENVASSRVVGLRPGVVDVDLADADGDGDLDLAVSMVGPTEVALLLNDGLGNFRVAQALVLASAVAPAGIALGDIDADGDGDLVLALQTLPNFAGVLRNDPGGFVDVSATALPLAYRNAGREPELDDVDGDGDLDLWFSFAAIRLWANDGSGNFAIDGRYPNRNAFRTRFEDLDGDGDADVVQAGSLPMTEIVENRGGTYVPVFQVPYSSTTLAASDVDGDGDLDVLLDSAVVEQVGGAWVGRQGYDQTSVAGAVIGDFDGDRDPDFLEPSVNGWVLHHNTTRQLHTPVPADRGFDFAIELQSRFPGGATATLAIAAPPRRQIIPIAGVLHLDPTRAWLQIVPLASGVPGSVVLAVPPTPNLAGLTLRTQALFVEGATATLSSFRSVRVR